MSSRIKLVRGDTGPHIRLTLTDQLSGDPSDLTGATVTLHFRVPESDTVLFSRPAYINPDVAITGVCYIEWAKGDLDQEEGDYEGEVEIVFGNGMRETIYDRLKFRIRKDFA